jgi:hypothetical protein
MDDLPSLSSTSGHDGPMPMFSPYHRFWFATSFKLAPPPKARFQPSSGKLMLQHTPSNVSTDAVPNFGIGPGQSAKCFAFDFYGAMVGCDSEESDCVFTFTGMRLNDTSETESQAVTQAVHVPACEQMEDCKLQHVSLQGFTAVTSINIDVQVDNEDRTWWADDLELGWSEDSCESATCRSRVRDTINTKSAGRRWVA